MDASLRAIGSRLRRFARPGTAAAGIVATATFFGLPRSALAACSKDTDCKGDRICVKGKCVPPGKAEPAPVPLAALERPGAPRVAPASLARAAFWHAVAGGALLGAGVLAAVPAAAMGLGSSRTDRRPVAVPLGAVGLLAIAAAGPVAGLGGIKTREGLRMLGFDTPGPALRLPGWFVYGSGMALGVAALIVGGVGVGGVAAGLGFGAAALGAVGGLLLVVDTVRSREMLQGAIRHAASASVETPGSRWTLGVVPAERGAALALAALW